MIQYVGLVIIMKELAIFWTHHHFLGKLIIAKRSHHGWRHIGDVIIIAKVISAPEIFRWLRPCSNKSVSTKVSKEIVPFQQEFPILKCGVEMIPLDIQSRTKKSDSDQKPPTPQPCDELRFLGKKTATVKTFLYSPIWFRYLETCFICMHTTLPTENMLHVRLCNQCSHHPCSTDIV